MSQASAFDPKLFLDASVSETNERRPPLPAENPYSPDGTYTSIMSEPTADTGTIEKGDRKGEPWLSMAVQHRIEVPQQMQDAMKLQPVVVITDRVFIDLTPQKTIDNSPGRNRRQRLYREALDLNKPGDVWNWRKVAGQAVKIKVEHEMYNGEAQDRIGALLRRT
jgi:hypothetical protein